ncbi:hypothetical protein [Burkholderia alba]|uniref:hypothetical protein n=1 Tax=Burkholderia alba TaxID=2683677 RepID=UPI002B060D53|nr:hypothetical protein [Burkholderia alba]
MQPKPNITIHIFIVVFPSLESVEMNARHCWTGRIIDVSRRRTKPVFHRFSMSAAAPRIT